MKHYLIQTIIYLLIAVCMCKSAHTRNMTNRSILQKFAQHTYLYQRTEFNFFQRVAYKIILGFEPATRRRASHGAHVSRFLSVHFVTTVKCSNPLGQYVLVSHDRYFLQS